MKNSAIISKALDGLAVLCHWQTALKGLAMAHALLIKAVQDKNLRPKSHRSFSFLKFTVLANKSIRKPGLAEPNARFPRHKAEFQNFGASSLKVEKAVYKPILN